MQGAGCWWGGLVISPITQLSRGRASVSHGGTHTVRVRFETWLQDERHDLVRAAIAVGRMHGKEAAPAHIVPDTLTFGTIPSRWNDHSR
jgi:hypothetical protein